MISPGPLPLNLVTSARSETLVPAAPCVRMHRLGLEVIQAQPALAARQEDLADPR